MPSMDNKPKYINPTFVFSALKRLPQSFIALAFLMLNVNFVSLIRFQNVQWRMFYVVIILDLMPADSLKAYDANFSLLRPCGGRLYLIRKLTFTWRQWFIFSKADYYI